MKELSIEEKAKAYDEILARAKAEYAKFEGMLPGDVLKDVFSELKESEDEKIRKELIQYFEKVELNYMNRDEILAWLEKQGSPVLSNYSNIGKNIPAEWSAEDERNINGILTVLESWDRYHISAAGLPSIIPEFINWLKSLKEKYTWKPNEAQITELHRVISGCSYDIEPLAEMAEQLKKLSEKQL